MFYGKCAATPVANKLILNSRMRDFFADRTLAVINTIADSHRCPPLVDLLRDSLAMAPKNSKFWVVKGVLFPAKEQFESSLLGSFYACRTSFVVLSNRSKLSF